MLVEFEPGHTPGFDFFLMEVELSHLLGRKVDLQTINFLSPGIRSSVLSEAVPAYEQAPGWAGNALQAAGGAVDAAAAVGIVL